MKTLVIILSLMSGVFSYAGSIHCNSGSFTPAGLVGRAGEVFETDELPGGNFFFLGQSHISAGSAKCSDQNGNQFDVKIFTLGPGLGMTFNHRVKILCSSDKMEGSYFAIDAELTPGIGIGVTLFLGPNEGKEENYCLMFSATEGLDIKLGIGVIKLEKLN